MKYSIPIQMLTVDQEGYHLMVSGNLNDYKINLLIDTGATLSVFDINRIRKIYPGKNIQAYNKFFMGIGSDSVETYSTVIDQINFGDYCIEDKMVVLIDLASINKAYAAFDLPRIDGVIGGDILKKHKAVINYVDETLELQY